MTSDFRPDRVEPHGGADGRRRQSAEHLLWCCSLPGRSDDVLRQVAELRERSSAALSVVVPVVDGATPSACCGIGGEHWQRLIDEDIREAMDDAVRRLESLGCVPTNAAVETGASLTQIAEVAAERWGCDTVLADAKRYPWSSGGFSRRELKMLRARMQTR